MPDIETIHEQIRARLAEVEQLIDPLRQEAEQLKQMAATFAAGGKGDGGSAVSVTPRRTATPRKAARRTPRSAPSGSGAKRGRPLGSGNRAQQAVAKIVEQPGITASELAKSMGISPNYLYRVLPRLEKEAKVTKQGRGYHPVGNADVATAPANGQPIGA